MLRAAAAALLAGLAGCGGSGGDADRTPAPPERGSWVRGEVRSPDARSPFVAARGAWRCETGGSIELRISPEGHTTLSIAGRILASVSPGRALINRACARGSARGLPAIGSPRAAAGAVALRCPAPRVVLVDLRRGDLAVRVADGGRFLAGAAVSYDHLDVGGYWTAGCERGA